MPREPKGTGKNLIILVHGCCTDKNELNKWDELGGKILAKIKNKKEWEIVVRDWTENTPPIGNPVYFRNYIHQAYEAAPSGGKKLAVAIAAAIKKSSVNSYEYVYLVARVHPD
jgi:hypothetical protein